MPVKQHKTHHRAHGEKHKRSKRFMKVYAPYIPVAFILSAGILLATLTAKSITDHNVLSESTGISRSGLLESTNRSRVERDKNEITVNEKLTKAAQLKAEDMVERDYWSHDTPDGKKPWHFLDRSGYDYRKAAENLAYGFDTNSSIVSGWLNSQTHRQNMLDDTISEVGFGIAESENYQNNGPQTVIVAMYGSPTDKPQNQLASDDKNVLAGNEAKITLAQSLTGGQAPWSGFVAGITLGGALMFLIIKHIRGIRKALLTSERFIIKHPVLDLAIIGITALAALLSQTSGIVH